MLAYIRVFIQKNFVSEQVKNNLKFEHTFLSITILPKEYFTYYSIAVMKQ